MFPSDSIFFKHLVEASYPDMYGQTYSFATINEYRYLPQFQKFPLKGHPIFLGKTYVNFSTKASTIDRYIFRNPHIEEEDDMLKELWEPYEICVSGYT